MYRASRPPQSAPERSESVLERSGAIYPDPTPALRHWGGRQLLLEIGVPGPRVEEVLGRLWAFLGFRMARFLENASRKLRFIEEVTTPLVVTAPGTAPPWSSPRPLAD